MPATVSLGRDILIVQLVGDQLIAQTGVSKFLDMAKDCLFVVARNQDTISVPIFSIGEAKRGGSKDMTIFLFVLKGLRSSFANLLSFHLGQSTQNCNCKSSGCGRTVQFF